MIPIAGWLCLAVCAPAAPTPGGAAATQAAPDPSPATRLAATARRVTYSDPAGWHVQYLAGWRVHDMSTPGPAGSVLLFFGLRPDSVERLAVAALPVSARTSADLMRLVMQDAPLQYPVLRVLSQGKTTQAGQSASWVDFRAVIDPATGEIVRSFVVTLVRGGTGYVISARTPLKDYDTRGLLMASLVRSFGFGEPRAQAHRQANRPAHAARHRPSLRAPRVRLGGR